jgi:squalene synthase HpnC
VVRARAYERCLQIASQHYENFPVASRLLPKPMRPYIAAVYAFARIADDFADEGQRTADSRIALLDDWEARLQRAIRGAHEVDDSDASAVFVALGDTIQKHALEPQLFSDLLSAFRQDVVVTRYATWEMLLDYCRRSANPVGRLVLRIAGHRTVLHDTASDAVCTALQLTNFWQDLERDWQKGRVYVPQSVQTTHGAAEETLNDRRLTPEWRAAMAECVARTRALFNDGRAIADLVSGRLRWELRATWLGGMRILDRLEAVDYDAFRARPTLGSRDALAIGWQALRW